MSLILSSKRYFSYYKHSWAYFWASVKFSYLLVCSSLNLFSWWKVGNKLLWLEILLFSSVPIDEFLRKRDSGKSSELWATRIKFLSLLTLESLFWLCAICLFMIKIEKNITLAKLSEFNINFERNILNKFRLSTSNSSIIWVILI